MSIIILSSGFLPIKAHTSSEKATNLIKSGHVVSVKEEQWCNVIFIKGRVIRQTKVNEAPVCVEIEQTHNGVLREKYSAIRTAPCMENIYKCVPDILSNLIMHLRGNSKQARKFAKQRFAQMKKMVSMKDPRVVEKKIEDNPKLKARLEKEKQKKADAHRAPQYSSALFFQYNSQLGPPFHVIIDTNFVNFSIKFKMDIIQSMMDCLYAKCTPYITDCVMAEMEKLGRKYRVALRIMKDPRYERLPCMHPGTYADDCIVQRVTQHKCYIVATNDKDLKRRIRKIPGVPIMYIQKHRYTIERMPDAYGAPRE